MKAISIQEPHISDIVELRKKLEIRSWRMSYRGKLLLVGSQSPAGRFSGLAACTVNLVDIRPMIATDEALALRPWDPKLFSWVLEDMKMIEPFRVRGQLSVYDVPDFMVKEKCRNSLRLW